jgi:hypothetical protein
VSEITTKPAIGSMRLGSLFLNIADADDHRPANHLIGRAGGEQRLELGHVGRMFADHTGHVSGFKTTGVRLCCSVHNSFGVAVMMVKLRILSPAGERQVPHNPAMPISRRLASAIA